MTSTRKVAGVLVALMLATPAGVTPAGADSFTPIRLQIRSPSAARLHRPLTVRVRITADAGVLDTRSAPLRIQVKLARECGGVFGQTPGTVLLNRRLVPQPQTGRAYEAAARGTARPRQAGEETLCTWLSEEGDGRVFASDQSVTVLVGRR